MVGYFAGSVVGDVREEDVAVVQGGAVHAVVAYAHADYAVLCLLVVGRGLGWAGLILIQGLRLSRKRVFFLLWDEVDHVVDANDLHLKIRKQCHILSRESQLQQCDAVYLRSKRFID